MIICILVNVALITLLERKILGYSQIRKGPNKFSLIGLFQPFNDAIKLFSKEIVLPIISNNIQFFVSSHTSINNYSNSFLFFSIF